MTAMTFTCINCGADAVLIAGEGTVLLQFKCPVCLNEFWAHVSPAVTDESEPYIVYRAFFDVASPEEVSKLKIKVRKALQGIGNFYLEDLEAQIAAGRLEWDLGRYSQYEVQAVEEAAAKMNLKVRFLRDT
ncbi:hypothetical protein [Lysobacter capsici]|uniref:hypothetical protein n=1 Tax=Lysobacter capsici TaxID=435897 RepID=UPI001C0043F6|nr:hypothetical protein [Lysobacter capsici]QWF16916.1 hypothetical protein KME82_24830 [Lysobacter capsici]